MKKICRETKYFTLSFFHFFFVRERRIICWNIYLFLKPPTRSSNLSINPSITTLKFYEKLIQRCLVPNLSSFLEKEVSAY